jgi:hypothetical protein
MVPVLIHAILCRLSYGYGTLAGIARALKKPPLSDEIQNGNDIIPSHEVILRGGVVVHAPR